MNLIIPGNVAYNKSAVQTGVWGELTADKAVDGLLDSHGEGNRYCAHPNTPNNPAMWTVDLGDSHRLYNITIYNRGDTGGITLSKGKLVLVYICHCKFFFFFFFFLSSPYVSPSMYITETSGY